MGRGTSLGISENKRKEEILIMSPQPAEMRNILARLERVERQNRWLVGAGLMVLLLGVVSVFESLALARQTAGAQKPPVGQKDKRPWFEKYDKLMPMTLMDYYELQTNLQLIREKVMSDGMEPADLYFDHESKKFRANVVVNSDEIRNESMDSLEKKFSTAAMWACNAAGLHIDGFDFTRDCEVEFRGLRRNESGDIKAVKFGEWKAGKMMLQESVLAP
jgi:hypothetical protein